MTTPPPSPYNVDAIFSIITPDQHRQLREAGFQVVPKYLVEGFQKLLAANPELSNIIRFPGASQ